MYGRMRELGLYRSICVGVRLRLRGTQSMRDSRHVWSLELGYGGGRRRMDLQKSSLRRPWFAAVSFW